jgi:SAM-dependent methyltransferase
VKEDKKSYQVQAKFFDHSCYVDGKTDTRLEQIISFCARITVAEKIKSALDIGCANGIVLDSLPAKVKKFGVDISTVLMEHARQKGIDAQICNVDETPLPFPDNCFDLVIATDVIEHVINTDTVLNEINRVLRPGGIFLTAIPNVNQPISLVMQFLLDLTPMFAARYRCPHYRDFSVRLFRLILKKHGFKVESCEGSYIFPFSKSGLSRFVARHAPRYSAQALFKARKESSIAIPEEYAANMPDLLDWLRK